MSVSISTPQTNRPSVRSLLDTIPSEDGRSEILTHDINRLLQYLHDLDQVRGQENHEIADNVRAIRDELYDLSDHLRRVPEPRQDRSVGGSSMVALDRPVPSGPRDVPVSPRPITLTPPPFRVPSPSSIMSSESFLSSYHSDDDILQELGSRSPTWSPPSSPPVPQPHEVSLVSVTTSGPYLSRTSSVSSLSTVRPRMTLDDLQDLLDRIGDGQRSTNNKLDEMQGRIPIPQDNAEVLRRLGGIEDLLQRVLDQSRPPRPEVVSFASEETESSSEPFSDLERLRDRLRDIIGQRDRPPAAAPPPSRPGPSLDEELAAILRAGPPAPTRGIERPPELTPFIYRPVPRTSRPRSASPTLPQRPATVPLEAPVQMFDVPRRRPLRRSARGTDVSHTPVIPPEPGLPRRPAADQVLHDPGRRARVEVPPPEPVLVSSHGINYALLISLTLPRLLV
jgi:hypothetical protein